jgi:hypothetical protein
MVRKFNVMPDIPPAGGSTLNPAPYMHASSWSLEERTDALGWEGMQCESGEDIATPVQTAVC